MTTVNAMDRWFDECAEAVIGLPVAEAILDVMSAGLHVEVSRPGVHRVRDGSQSGVVLVSSRRGVVLDVLRLEEHTAPERRPASTPLRVATT